MSMVFRDDREALRARAEDAEEKLAEANREIERVRAAAAQRPPPVTAAWRPSWPSVPRRWARRVAIGAGIPSAGGHNESATHWDMVKDLRPGGRIELDGELVQENGEWTF